jgi:hypothetical protein
MAESTDGGKRGSGFVGKSSEMTEYFSGGGRPSILQVKRIRLGKRIKQNRKKYQPAEDVDAEVEVLRREREVDPL